MRATPESTWRTSVALFPQGAHTSLPEKVSCIIASEHFTSEQKSRLISLWELRDAAVKFGPPLLYQLQRDYWLGFKFWDTASMILQSEQLCATEKDVHGFSEWTFRFLGYDQPVEDWNPKRERGGVAPKTS